MSSQFTPALQHFQRPPFHFLRDPKEICSTKWATLAIWAPVFHLLDLVNSVFCPCSSCQRKELALFSYPKMWLTSGCSWSARTCSRCPTGIFACLAAWDSHQTFQTCVLRLLWTPHPHRLLQEEHEM